MTPKQRIKREIINQVIRDGDFTYDGDITESNLKEIWDTLYEENGSLQDRISDFRSSGTNTGLECDWSRHYESHAVAAKLSDGTWVGWTYWYGGGKHGEPEAIEWMSYAYEVNCVEEEKLVVVQTFTKKGEQTA
jgi:hypothetical protein